MNMIIVNATHLYRKNVTKRLYARPITSIVRGKILEEDQLSKLKASPAEAGEPAAAVGAASGRGLCSSRPATTRACLQTFVSGGFLGVPQVLKKFQIYHVVPVTDRNDLGLRYTYQLPQLKTCQFVL